MINTKIFIENLENKYGQLIDEWYDNNGSGVYGKNNIKRNAKENRGDIAQKESKSDTRNNNITLPGIRTRSRNFSKLLIDQSKSGSRANTSESNGTKELDNSSFFDDHDVDIRFFIEI